LRPSLVLLKRANSCKHPSLWNRDRQLHINPLLLHNCVWELHCNTHCCLR
jgi:hypothetical protein